MKEKNPHGWSKQALTAYNYLKDMLDNIADPVFVKNKAHQWVDGNKAFWELMGGPPEKFAGLTDYDIFPKEEADVFWQQDNKVFATGQPDINEEFLTDREGKRHIISTKKAIFLDENEEEVLVGIIRDVTAQKQLEELKARTSQAHLQTKEKQYQSIFKSTSDAMLIFNRHGNLIEANPTACAMYGYDYEEFIGMHGRDFVPAADHDKFHRFLECVQSGERYFVESKHLRKDGSSIFVEINGTSFEYNGAFHVLAAVRDITERKRAVEQFTRLSQEAEQQRRIYNTVLSNTADFNYVFDLDGNCTYINKAMLDFLKKNQAEAVGRNFLELGYPADLARRLQGQIQQVIATKEPLKDEAIYSSARGSFVHEYIFQPVLSANGRVEAVAGSTRDITSLKLADRRKDEFLATLAHELRNPLAPIRNAIEILKRSDDNDLREKSIITIARQLDHMVHLVDDLMDVSRITQGKFELRTERVTLGDIIHHACETSEPLMRQSSHAFSISLPQETIWLKADFARSSQIFSNLLNNAAKYTNPGGRISLSAAVEEGRVKVTVADTGIGIPPRMLPHIFDMFLQLDTSLERSQGGLGIGLTLVKSLVEMQGGAIEVQSVGLGSGSTFTVRLPLAEAEAPAAPATVPAPQTNAAYRVLIVDDNQPSAKTLGWMLEMLGHETQLAFSGASAIEAARTFHPQVVLLDIGLPGMNGYEVCAALRKEPGMANSLFIAQTGWGQQEHRQRSREAGFHHHLVKPIKLEQLQHILGGTMEYRKQA